MKDHQIKSLQANLTAFLKPLSIDEYISLTDWVCYKSLETPFTPPDALAKKFIDEFLGESSFARLLSDIREPNKIFLSASLSERNLFTTLRVALMQESFFFLKFQVKEEKPVKPVKVKTQFDLSKEDKVSFNEIFVEHKAMLEYQLEDEDFIRNMDEEGEKLLEDKKRHLNFIKRFGKLK